MLVVVGLASWYMFIADVARSSEQINRQSEEEVAQSISPVKATKIVTFMFACTAIC